MGQEQETVNKEAAWLWRNGWMCLVRGGQRYFFNRYDHFLTTPNEMVLARDIKKADPDSVWDRLVEIEYGLSVKNRSDRRRGNRPFNAPHSYGASGGFSVGGKGNGA